MVSDGESGGRGAFIRRHPPRGGRRSPRGWPFPPWERLLCEKEPVLREAGAGRRWAGGQRGSLAGCFAPATYREASLSGAESQRATRGQGRYPGDYNSRQPLGRPAPLNGTAALPRGIVGDVVPEEFLAGQLPM